MRLRKSDGNALLVVVFGVNDATLETGGRRMLPLELAVCILRTYSTVRVTVLFLLSGWP